MPCELFKVEIFGAKQFILALSHFRDVSTTIGKLTLAVLENFVLLAAT